MYIYKRTNLINGKVYIGQTIQEPKKRWNVEDQSNQEIGKAVRKYGKENFKNEIIDIAKDRNELNQKERYWIKYYDSNNSDKGYNKTQGGSGGIPPTYRKIIIWKSEQILFPTEKSLINYIFTNQNLYTVNQIARLVRIGLRTKNVTINFNNMNVLGDFYLFDEYNEDISSLFFYL